MKSPTEVTQKNILQAMLRKAESLGLEELVKEIHAYAKYCEIEL